MKAFFNITSLFLLNRKFTIGQISRILAVALIKRWLKYGWFHLKLYSMSQDLSRRSIETGF